MTFRNWLRNVQIVFMEYVMDFETIISQLSPVLYVIGLRSRCEKTRDLAPRRYTNTTCVFVSYAKHSGFSQVLVIFFLWVVKSLRQCNLLSTQTDNHYFPWGIFGFVHFPRNCVLRLIFCMCANVNKHHVRAVLIRLYAFSVTLVGFCHERKGCSGRCKSCDHLACKMSR